MENRLYGVHSMMNTPLPPAKARAYELPSLSGAESDNIVILLMSLPDPSKKIIECIENAIEWFKASKIEGNEERVLHE